MKTIRFTLVALATLMTALVAGAGAQEIYNQVNVSIPVSGTYNIDLNGDGVADFTLTSKLLQAYCTSGDEFIWTLTVAPAKKNAVVAPAQQTGPISASALLIGVPVNNTQSFASGGSLLAELYWGSCGIGTLGQWLNLPDRYLGLQFQDSFNNTHYGWAKVSTVAYVDQHGNLHASTLLSAYAYRAMPGEGIVTGE